MDRTRRRHDGLRLRVRPWPLIVVVVAPLILSIAVTATIDATYGNIGTAAVPFVLAAYFLGVTLWAVMQIALPKQFCFLTAIGASSVCLVGALRGSNLLAWLLVCAIGGLFAAAPAVRGGEHDRGAST